MGHFKPLAEPVIEDMNHQLRFRFQDKIYIVNYDWIMADHKFFAQWDEHIYGLRKEGIGWHVLGGKIWREDLEYNIDDDEAKAAIAHFRTIAHEEGLRKGIFYYVWGG